MKFLSRIWPRLFLFLYTGVLLYGTLSPFRFTWHPGRNTMNVRRQVEWIPFTRSCPTHGVVCPRDAGLNLAMFLPFGALAALISRTGVGLMRRVARATILGFGLSLLIETTQYFIPARFPGATDILLNTAGAALGGLFIAGMFKTKPFSTNRP